MPRNDRRDDDRRDGDRNGDGVTLSDFHTYDIACELADRMEMTKKEAEKFVQQAMAEAGFRQTQTRDSYVVDDSQENDRRRFRRGANQTADSRTSGHGKRSDLPDGWSD